MRNFIRDTRGATVVETALAIPLLLVMTFGIIEMLFYLYSTNMAAKATERGARLAIIARPVAVGLDDLTAWWTEQGKLDHPRCPCVAPAEPIVQDPNDPLPPCPSGPAVAGNLDPQCPGPDYYDVDCIASDIGTGTCSNGAEFNTAVFQRIYRAMLAMKGDLQPQDVLVSYRYAGLGFVGDPRASMTVNVSIRCGTHQFIAMDGLAGLVGSGDACGNPGFKIQASSTPMTSEALGILD